MEFIGIGFVVLCYFFGKSELVKHLNRHELELLNLLPEEERVSRVKQLLDTSAEE